MTRINALKYWAIFLLLAIGNGAQALTATPGFTISATNITLPSSGIGYIPFTLKSVNGYTGDVFIGCTTASPSAGTLEPYCDPPHFGASLSVVLTASSPTVKASVLITSLPEPTTSSRLNRPGFRGGTAWVLSCALLLGFGFRRWRARWPALLLLGIGTLIGFVGISACGGGSSIHETLTPGVYTYTIQAVDQSIPQKSANTTVKVTVPPGIPIQPGP